MSEKGKIMIRKTKTSCLLFFSFLAFFSHHILAQEKPSSDRTSGQKRVVAPKAISLAKPVYPSVARALRMGAQVIVRITIDETGNVVSAKAETGDPLLSPSGRVKTLAFRRRLQ
jgi:outer membrane biosynthesis protein TonB